MIAVLAKNGLVATLLKHTRPHPPLAPDLRPWQLSHWYHPSTHVATPAPLHTPLLAGGWQGVAGKPYVRFVMFKENMDTHAALNVVGRMLHQAPGRFGFAGGRDPWEGLMSHHGAGSTQVFQTGLRICSVPPVYMHDICGLWLDLSMTACPSTIRGGGLAGASAVCSLCAGLVACIP
jgi:hypothetical protein